MTDWPVGGGQQAFTGPATEPPTNSRGALLTPGAANVKGSYVDVITAGNNLGADWLLVALGSAIVDETLTDIAVGAAGVEQVLVPNLLVQTMNRDMSHFVCPVKLPAGVLVRARCQAEGGSGSVVACSVTGIGNGWSGVEPCATCTAWGVVTATTRGTPLTSGAANVKGAWTELVSAANNLAPTRYLTLLVFQRSATIGSSDLMVDIGIGPATEQVLVPNLALSCSGTRDNAMPQLIGPLPISIPAGVRVSVRLQSSVASITWEMCGYSFA